MRELAFDASGTTLAAAVFDNGLPLSDFKLKLKETHSLSLLPLINSVLTFAKTEIRDIERIYVANGPGSFTGLRIAVATAKGLAHAHNIPLVGVSTLKSLSYKAAAHDGLIGCILDARRDRVYGALYDGFGGRALIEEGVYEIETYCSLALPHLGKNKLSLIGDGVVPYLSDLERLLKGGFLYLKDGDIASAVGVYYAAKAYGEKDTDYDGLSPIYLRRPQAEREKYGEADD